MTHLKLHAITALTLALSPLTTSCERQQPTAPPATPPPDQGTPPQAPAPDLTAPPATALTQPPRWLAAKPSTPPFELHIRPDGVWLSATPERAINLWPTLTYSSRSPQARAATQDQQLSSPAQHSLSPPSLTNHEDGSWTLSATDALPYGTLTIKLHAQANSPALQMTIDVAYTRDVLIEQESLRFDTAQLPTPQQLDRDYQWRSASKPVHTSTQTPLMARWPWLSLYATDALGMSAQAKTITLDLDHREHHPFKLYPSCPSQDALPSRYLDYTPRRAGERATYHLLWQLSPSSLPLPRRFPRGHLSAIVMTDHADQNQLERTEAFAFGATGATASETTPTTGFLGHQLSLTKSVFLTQTKGYNPQLDSLAFSELLDTMSARGARIALHSLSGATDDPLTAKALIDKAQKRYTIHSWIDHGPGTNCEAISNQGADPDSPHYMLKLLEDAKIRTIWAVQDLPTKGLNLLSPQGSARRPILYRHHRLKHSPTATAPLLFASAWFFGAKSSWSARFSTKQLDALDREHGLLIAHTYLDVWRKDGKFAPRSLLDRTGENRFAIKPEIDAIWATLARRQAQHLAMTEGIDTIGQHLVQAVRARMTPQPDGSLRIEHTGPLPLQGFTLRLPPQTQKVWLDGQPWQERLRREDGLDIWFDLEPNSPRILRAQDEQGKDLLAHDPIMLRIQIDDKP